MAEPTADMPSRKAAPGAPRASAALLASLLLALGATVQAAVDTSAGAASGGKAKVTCSSLPELQHLSLKVAILGDCTPDEPASGGSTVSALSMDSEEAAPSPAEGWIFQWKKSAVAAGEGNGRLSGAACAEAEEAGKGRFNASCTHRYSSALPGFAARFGGRSQVAAFLEAYADDLESAAPDGVVSVKQGVDSALVADPSAGEVQIDTLDSYKWGLDRIDQPSLPLDGLFRYWNGGAGVHVYVLDTGIRATHEEFRFSDGRPGSRASEVFYAPSLGPGNAGLDCEGHGTHVAGVVGGLAFGVAKQATLHAVRILDCQGNGAVSDVLLALDWLKQNAQRPAIVSMSLGGDVQLQLDAAVKSVADSGIHVVVAAGNEDIDACDTSPAREASAVTVGATNSQDQRLWLAAGKGSNYGQCVDLFAPGTDIISAAGTSNTAQQLRTGTSQAVPFVAGVMALILQNNSAIAPPDLQRLLAASAASGKLSEVPGSQFASFAASATPNLMVQSTSSPPFTVSPRALPAITSTAAGPFGLTVALGQQPWTDVQMKLSVDPARGTLEPATLQFSAESWATPQSVELRVFPFDTTDSSPLAVTLTATSGDTLFQTNQTVLALPDLKGDTLQYPKAVLSLPFSEAGSTAGQYTEQYSVTCGASDADKGGAPDVVYYFKPAADCAVTASLCASASLPSTFDSRLYLLADVDQGGALQAAACSNNACGVLPSLTAQLKAGVGYAFVVDGVDGASGQYSISITAAEGAIAGQPPPASLQKSSVSVASTGPAADPSSAGAATASRYWLLGPWSKCATDCTQTRSVSCYDVQASGTVPDVQCSSLSKPASQQRCSSDCSVQANSSLVSNVSDGSDAAAGSGGGSGSSGSGSVVIIAACAAGAVLAVAAAVGGFLLVRRRRRQQQVAEAEGKGQPAYDGQGKWGAEEAGGVDIIPLPKSLRPIATGRQGQQQPGEAPPAGLTRNLSAAAGVMAAQQQQQQYGGGAAAFDPAAAAVAHLQALAPDYHVVHLPSPRLTRQDTGSPWGLRRSLRQRSPTRRPREASRFTPDAAAAEGHRLSRSSSGHPAHDA